ncbi:MAG: hypothetical protein EOO43_15145 [Flavobacterium sp.]|nr:MAG: hypothetical protein EOO43_15145 [Flavobacterium sp.]
MEIRHLLVSNPILAKYIDHYYILTTGDKQGNANYIAYPTIHTPLCFLDQCIINIQDEFTSVKKEATKGLTSVIVGRSVRSDN